MGVVPVTCAIEAANTHANVISNASTDSTANRHAVGNTDGPTDTLADSTTDCCTVGNADAVANTLAIDSA